MTNLQRGARLRAVALVALAALGLSACATRGYVDEQISGVNTRIDAVEARIQEATRRADAASTDSRTATQRIDQLEGRVTRLESTPSSTTSARRPRG